MRSLVKGMADAFLGISAGLSTMLAAHFIGIPDGFAAIMGGYVAALTVHRKDIF